MFVICATPRPFTATAFPTPRPVPRAWICAPDADYRGEIVIWLLNTSDAALSVRRGERVAQLVFQPVCRLEPLAAEELSDTERGDGGFGHTGRV